MISIMVLLVQLHFYFTKCCLSYCMYISKDFILFSFYFFTAAYVSLTSIILVELLGLDKLTNSFGLLILFRGGASLVGTPFAGKSSWLHVLIALCNTLNSEPLFSGAMYDLTKGYTLPFCVAGGLIVFSALLSFLVPCVKRWSNAAERPKFSIEPDGGDDAPATANGETTL